MDSAIRARGLWKQYTLGAGGARFQYQTLREALVRATARPRRWLGGRPPSFESTRIWALADVGFDVRPGEVLGVIGPNGAGKSTLLKVLSRITEPTRGRAEIKGRVASLLEVDTGFHPELTGRENIYLNGAILGLRHGEIQRKLDEIVEFAEIARFIDAPVKGYSSGMSLRLAFAVASHLEPEILLVDEVLAAGDASFQRKCLGRMDMIARGGRTVLLVSHNMEAIRRLSQTTLFLDKGRLRFAGSTPDAIAAYFRALAEDSTAGGQRLDWYRRPRSGDEPVTIRALSVNGREDLDPVEMLDDLVLTIEIESTENVPEALVTLVIRDEAGHVLTRMFSNTVDWSIALSAGVNVVRCAVPAHPFTPGRYHVDVGVSRSAVSGAWDVILGYPCFSVYCGAKAERLGWPDRPWGAFHLDSARWGVEVTDRKRRQPGASRPTGSAP